MSVKRLPFLHLGEGWKLYRVVFGFSRSLLERKKHLCKFTWDTVRHHRSSRSTILSSFIPFSKGLVVCHSFCINLSLYSRYIHTSYIHKHTLRAHLHPYLHSCRLSARDLHEVPSRGSNSGLPTYSKPACYQLSHAFFRVFPY
jgi:hypothetical protein